MNTQTILSEGEYINSAEAVIHNLEERGQSISENHKQALFKLDQLLVEVINGERKGRFVYPLDTGGGKTESVISFITSLYATDSPRSVMVCCSRIEQLNRIINDLMKGSYGRSIPRTEVGFYHTDYSGKYISFDKPEEIYQKRYIFITHNKAKTPTTATQLLFNFDGRPRDLIIWDESFISRKGITVHIESLFEALKILDDKVRRVKAKGDTYHHYHEAMKLKPMLKEFRDAIDLEVSRCNAKINTNFIFPMMGVTTEEFKTMIGRIIGSSKWTQSICDLVDLVEYQSIGLRLVKFDSDYEFITYREVIPSHINNLVILDANGNLCFDYALDKSITVIDCPYVRDHSNVQVMHWTSAAGKSIMKKIHSGSSENTVSQEIAHIIHTIHQDQPNDSILIFHSKDAESEHVPNPYRQAIEQELIRLGINPDSVTTIRKRVVEWLTWGREDATNDFAHCKHIICASQLFLPPSQYYAQMLAASGEILFKGDFFLYKLKSQASRIYQAISRGNMRKNINGKAGDMTIHLFHPHASHIVKQLGNRMTGLNCVSYMPVYMRDKTPKAITIQSKIGEWLAQNDDVYEISARKFKRDCPHIKGCNDKMIQRIKKKISDNPDTNWKYVKGRLVKQV